MTRHTCITVGAVSLVQTGFDRFSVTYGKSTKEGLDYAQAASEFGACVMHDLACEGRLDNRTRSEALTLAKRARLGARAACRHCGQDIEFSCVKTWTDRGGNRSCCPFIRDGEIVRPKTQHAP